MTHEIHKLTVKQARKAGVTLIPDGYYALHIPVNPSQCAPKIAVYNAYNEHIEDVLLTMKQAFSL